MRETLLQGDALECVLLLQNVFSYYERHCFKGMPAGIRVPYVCLTCALRVPYVCLICVPSMCALYACLMCVPYMRALYACLICVPYMCAFYVCLIYVCLVYVYIMYVQPSKNALYVYMCLICVYIGTRCKRHGSKRMLMWTRPHSRTNSHSHTNRHQTHLNPKT